MFIFTVVFEFLFLVVSTPQMDDENYCGIYAVAGASHALGRDVENFEELIQEKFISSELGSSARDLTAAAEFLGFNITRFRSLGKTSLLNCEDPMILHVTSDGQLVAYNHWILFLGIAADGKARILDSNQGSRDVSLQKLCSRWDGVALVAHLGEKPNQNYQKFELQRGCLLIIIAGIAVIASVLIFQPIANHLLRGTAILLFSIIFLVLLDKNSAMWSYSPNFVFRTLRVSDFEKIEYEELTEMLDSDVVTLVDARKRSSFQRRSIQGAVNIPVNASDALIENVLDKLELDDNSLVVVYCSNSKCSFDDIVANRLTAAGVKDIRIFHEGMNGWLRHQTPHPSNLE